MYGMCRGITLAVYLSHGPSFPDPKYPARHTPASPPSPSYIYHYTILIAME